MTDLEYAQCRIAHLEHSLDNLCLIVGYALPHTQEQIRNMGMAWDKARSDLDARKAAATKTPII